MKENERKLKATDEILSDTKKKGNRNLSEVKNKRKSTLKALNSFITKNKKASEKVKYPQSLPRSI